MGFWATFAAQVLAGSLVAAVAAMLAVLVTNSYAARRAEEQAQVDRAAPGNREYRAFKLLVAHVTGVPTDSRPRRDRPRRPDMALLAVTGRGEAIVRRRASWLMGIWIRGVVGIGSPSRSF